MAFTMDKNQMTTDTVKIDRNLPLASGITLPSYHLAYTIYGNMNSSSKIGLVFHGLSSNSDLHTWWKKFKINDLTAQASIISFNCLGSCFGSSGPLDDPNFPSITISDSVTAIALALEQMNIRKLDFVLGCSLGGMQTLDMYLNYPALSSRFVAAAAAPLPIEVKLYNQAQLQMFSPDTLASKSDDELAQRMAYARFFFRLSCTTPIALEKLHRQYGSALDYFIKDAHDYKLEFNPTSYYLLMKAITDFGLPEIPSRSTNPAYSHSKLHLVSIENDAFTPPPNIVSTYYKFLNANHNVTRSHFNSIYGHEAWILDGEKFYDHIEPFL